MNTDNTSALINTPQTFEPHVTVATVVERDGKFLFVEEKSQGEIVLNQPAGHLEAGENLIEAAMRETYEETGWHVEISAVLSVTLYKSPSNNVTYHRTTFIGQPRQYDQHAVLDQGILRSLWLSKEEVLQHSAKPRSPIVLQSVEQYLTGQHYPLSMVGDCL